jgi:hypothetical protein
MELVRFERKSVPGSFFEIPGGYKKTEGASGNLTAEQQKQFNDALSQMTPEERKRFEEMMKKQQGEHP